MSKTKSYSDFLKSLDNQTRSVIQKHAVKLQKGNTGNVKRILTCNMVKKFIKPIFELSIDKGPGYRIYFTKNHSNKIQYLNAGLKKTQRQDIKIAQRNLEKEVY